jgi:dihydrodipicolinate reductase
MKFATYPVDGDHALTVEEQAQEMRADGWEQISIQKNYLPSYQCELVIDLPDPASAYELVMRCADVGASHVAGEIARALFFRAIVTTA